MLDKCQNHGASPPNVCISNIQTEKIGR